MVDREALLEPGEGPGFGARRIGPGPIVLGGVGDWVWVSG